METEEDKNNQQQKKSTTTTTTNSKSMIFKYIRWKCTNYKSII